MTEILEVVRTRIAAAHLRKRPIRMTDAELLAFADAAYAVARTGGDVGIEIMFASLPEDARAKGIECAFDRIPVMRDDVVMA